MNESTPMDSNGQDARSLRKQIKELNQTVSKAEKKLKQAEQKIEQAEHKRALSEEKLSQKLKDAEALLKQEELRRQEIEQKLANEAHLREQSEQKLAQSNQVCTKFHNELKELRPLVRQIAQVNQVVSKLQEQNKSLQDSEKSLNAINRELKSKCMKMENILLYGNVSTLSTLIDQLTSYCTPIIRQIFVEAHLVMFDKSERDKVSDLVHYLNDTAIQLQKFVALPSFIVSEAASKKQLKQTLNRIKTSINGLSSSLDRLEPDQIRIVCLEVNEFFKFLDSFREVSK